ncbi:hypothetical protein TELCIR_23577, partial [Teladorsagia circumcincta]
FWDAYNTAVHANPSLSPVLKFYHLRSLLKGDAQAIVQGYDITAENYKYAVRTLRETYYRPQLIRTQLSKTLQYLEPAGASASEQRTTLAQIKSLWLQLRKLGDSEDNIYVMRFIRQKFPQRTLEHLGSLETADPTPWKVPQLLDGLDRAIRIVGRRQWARTVDDSGQGQSTKMGTWHQRRLPTSVVKFRSSRCCHYVAVTVEELRWRWIRLSVQFEVDVRWIVEDYDASNTTMISF